MTLKIWKRSQRDSNIIIECPSRKATTVFEINGGKIVGIGHDREREVFWLINLPEGNYKGVVNIIKDMKANNIQFDNDN